MEGGHGGEATGRGLTWVHGHKPAALHSAGQRALVRQGRCSYPGPPSVERVSQRDSVRPSVRAGLSGCWAKPCLVLGGCLRAATVRSPGQAWPYFGKTCGAPRQHGDDRAYRCRLCGPAAVHAIHGAITHDARARARTRACQFSVLVERPERWCLLPSRSPSYDVVLRCRGGVQRFYRSRGSGRACTEPHICARTHKHTPQEWRLQDFIAGNATALQKDLNGTKRDLDIGWLILCGALVFFMQVVCVYVCVRYLGALRVCAHTQTCMGCTYGVCIFMISGGICDAGGGHRAKQEHGKYSVQKCD